MCEKMWVDICLSKNKWISHKCKRPGCAEGYVTVDGNEFLKRSKCAAPIEKIKARKDLPNVILCCTNSPLPGGKHQIASKMCAVHDKIIIADEREKMVNNTPLPPEFNKNKHECNIFSEHDQSISDPIDMGCRKKLKVICFLKQLQEY